MVQRLGCKTLRKEQSTDVLLAGLLTLCTLIKLSTLPVRLSPTSVEHHPAQWPVSYVWLCFWSELSKNFPPQRHRCYSIRRASPARHSLQPSVSECVGWEFRSRRLQATWLSLFSFPSSKCFNLVQAHLHSVRCLFSSSIISCSVNIIGKLFTKKE